MKLLLSIITLSISTALFTVGVASTDSNFIIASGVFSITFALFMKGGAE